MTDPRSRREEDGKAPRRTRREFLKRAAGGYALPAVLTPSITEVYDEETGYALAQASTPPWWEHHHHHHHH